jgi:hypothetical protein
MKYVIVKIKYLLKDIILPTLLTIGFVVIIKVQLQIQHY